MIDDKAASKALWGEESAEPPVASPEAPSAAPEALSASEASAAKELWPEPEPAPVDAAPAAVKEMREADLARTLYDPQVTYKQAVTAEDMPDLPEGDRAAVIANARSMFDDLGLSTEEARTLTDLVKHGAPDAQTEAAWQEEIIDQLKARHGKDEQAAQAEVALVQALAHRDPRIAKVLNSTRLGNHPKVVEIFLRRSRDEKVNGRLK